MIDKHGVMRVTVDDTKYLTSELVAELADNGKTRITMKEIHKHYNVGESVPSKITMVATMWLSPEQTHELRTVLG